ncbi:MAG TPA: methyl-accepting chemotaxis protein [Halanaerobiales bacterium]|nr:methyl-accepting chemotaxis protein [Halanaerobiales bacterium]
MSVLQPATIIFFVLIVLNPLIARFLGNLLNLNHFYTEVIISLILIISYIFFNRFRGDKSKKKLLKKLKLIAAGDFRQEIRLAASSKLSNIADIFNNIMTDIRRLFKKSIQTSVEISEDVDDLSQKIEDVYQTTEEINSAVSEVAQGAEEQSLNLENTNQEIEEILNFVNNTFAKTKEVAATSGKAAEIAEAGNNSIGQLIDKSNKNKKIIQQTKDEMNKLQTNFEEMTEIVGSIEKVSNQTALLALNASIEAARAGDAGRGFGVLAREIRDFSMDVDKLVDNINEVMDRVNKQINTTVERMDENVEIINEQDVRTENLGDDIAQLHSIVSKNYQKIDSLKEDTKKVTEIIDSSQKSFAKILSISQQTAANSQQVTASIENQQTMIADIEDKVKVVDEMSVELRNFFASKAMDETMLNLCEKIKDRKKKDGLNNQILHEIKEESDIDEIYIVSEAGEFIKSTIDSILGANLFEINEWARDFVEKNAEQVITPIHRRVEDNKLYKFAMVKDNDGEIIEVGLSLESLV